MTFIVVMAFIIMIPYSIFMAGECSQLLRGLAIAAAIVVGVLALKAAGVPNLWAFLLGDVAVGISLWHWDQLGLALSVDGADNEDEADSTDDDE